jgi:hypothetical protein
VDGKKRTESRKLKAERRKQRAVVCLLYLEELAGEDALFTLELLPEFPESYVGVCDGVEQGM